MLEDPSHLKQRVIAHNDDAQLSSSPTKTTTPPTPVHFDWLVTHRLGEFGPYQRRTYLLLGLPAITCAMHALSWVFLGANVPHRCLLPGESPTNTSYNATLPDSLPPEHFYPIDPATGKQSQCDMYYYDDGETENRTTLPCSGFVFDTSQYHTSARIDFNLLCTTEIWYSIAETLFKCGILVGALLFGSLSDRFGRRPVFFYALCQQLACGVIAAFAPNYTVFVVARFLIGMANSGVFLVAFVIAMELVGKEKRVIAGLGMQYFFTVGWLVIGLLAIFIREWRHLQLAISLPSIMFMSYYWFLPESIRWLLTHDRAPEAGRILQKAAEINGKTITPEDLSNLTVIPTSPSTSTSLLTALRKHRTTALRSLNIFFCWFVNSGVYYGLALNSQNLGGGNDYANFLLSGAVEVPAYTMLLLTLNRFGRKRVLCSCMLLSGVFLVACGFSSNSSSENNPSTEIMLITFNMLGKLFNAAGYAAIYMYSAELFPTVIRNSGMGVASVSARIGGILSDYVIILRLQWRPLPHLVFGIVSLTSGLLSLLLPETLGKRLPDTLEDSDKFGTSSYDESESVEKNCVSDNKHGGSIPPTKIPATSHDNATYNESRM